MPKSKIKKGQVELTIDPQLYPLEAVYGAAYVFLDKAYLRLDGNPKKKIIIKIKGKESLDREKLENLAGDFLNELLNYSLRYKISKNNRKIREYIVGTALLSSLAEAPEAEEKEEWEEDPLGIAVPWEEKHKKR